MISTILFSHSTVEISQKVNADVILAFDKYKTIELSFKTWINYSKLKNTTVYDHIKLQLCNFHLKYCILS